MLSTRFTVISSTSAFSIFDCSCSGRHKDVKLANTSLQFARASHQRVHCHYYDKETLHISPLLNFRSYLSISDEKSEFLQTFIDASPSFLLHQRFPDLRRQEAQYTQLHDKKIQI